MNLRKEDTDLRKLAFFEHYFPKLFAHYLEDDHLPGFEMILDMFERGHQSTFLSMNVEIKKMLTTIDLPKAVKDILSIINTRTMGGRMTHMKETTQFLVWLYKLDTKQVELFIQSFETSESAVAKNVANICRHILKTEASEQLRIEFK